MNNDKNNKKDNEQSHHSTQSRFPITKPGLCSTSPKFPYRDIRHYTDPCCDAPKQCQYGYIAQTALNQPHSPQIHCHSAILPTSHPWFEPSTI